jgi:hypothetical protein
MILPFTGAFFVKPPAGKTGREEARMKVIIAGSRRITEYSLVERAVRESEFQVTEVLSGGARGVDCLGEEWGKRNGVPVRHFPADWEHYGKRAGYLRNEQMADCAEGLIALWDGESPGTGHMIGIAQNMGLRVFVLRPDGGPAQGSVTGRVVYDRTFYPDSGEVEARAVIVDDSDDDHLEFLFEITERLLNGREAVTYQGKLGETCTGIPGTVRRTLWRNLFQQARDELDREIRIARDPFYDIPEPEIY